MKGVPLAIPRTYDHDNWYCREVEARLATVTVTVTCSRASSTRSRATKKESEFAELPLTSIASFTFVPAMATYR